MQLLGLDKGLINDLLTTCLECIYVPLVGSLREALNHNELIEVLEDVSLHCSSNFYHSVDHHVVCVVVPPPVGDVLVPSSPRPLGWSPGGPQGRPSCFSSL